MIFEEITEKDIQLILSSKLHGFDDCWTEKMLLDAFKNSAFSGIKAMEGERCLGYVTYTLSFDTADIEAVFTFPQFRRKGVAKGLLNALVVHVTAKGVKKIFLEVRKSNVSAISFYEKSGFNIINERKKYYSDGENALIYLKEI